MGASYQILEEILKNSDVELKFDNAIKTNKFMLSVIF